MKRGHRKADTGTADCWALGIYPKGGKWPCWPGSTFHSLGGDPGPGKQVTGLTVPRSPEHVHQWMLPGASQLLCSAAGPLNGVRTHLADLTSLLSCSCLGPRLPQSEGSCQ